MPLKLTSDALVSLQRNDQCAEAPSPQVAAMHFRDPEATTSPAIHVALDPRLDEYVHPPPGWRDWVFITILCLTQLFTQSALGYILIPLASVSRTFGQDGPQEAAQMNWHVAAFSLTVGTFILLTGRVGDVYGFKKIFLLGWIWFGAWSIVCGCSAFTDSAIFFDTARALQGIGPALLLPSALAIAGRAYPPSRKKNIVFSLIAMSAPLGCSTAGLIGSALAQHVWWPWSPWIYGIGCFAVALVAYFIVPQDRMSSSTGVGVDWLGAALGITGLLLLNISWNQAPIDGWPAPHVYVLLILGFIFISSFCFQEKRTSHPILDLSLFNSKVTGTLVITALGWSSFGVWFYYIFQFLQHIRSVSELESAVQFLPGAISGMIAAVATTWLLETINTAWLMILASAAFFLGCLLMAVAPVEQTYWLNTFFSFIIMPWGMDVSFPACTLFLSDAVPIQHQGVSASLINIVVNYSIAIGLGIAGTVEVQVHPQGKQALEGYRAAQYTSVGLAGTGLLVSVIMGLSVANIRRNGK